MGRYQEYLDAVDVLTDGMSNYDPRQPELFCRRAGALAALDRADEATLWAARSCAMGFWPCCEGPEAPGR